MNSLAVSQDLVWLCTKPLRMAVWGWLRGHADDDGKVGFSSTWTEYFGLDPNQRQVLRTVLRELLERGFITKPGDKDRWGRVVYVLCQNQSEHDNHNKSSSQLLGKGEDQDQSQLSGSWSWFVGQVEPVMNKLRDQYPGVDVRLHRRQCRERYQYRNITIQHPVAVLTNRLAKSTVYQHKVVDDVSHKVRLGYFAQFGADVVRWVRTLDTDLQYALQQRVQSRERKMGLRGVDMARLRKMANLLSTNQKLSG